ncbi:MAG: helix-turn-helix domain-containing protein [Saprospiraceae bacterium]
MTREQRYTISMMKNQGYKQKDISIAIGKDKSVISRELKRNCDQRSGICDYDLAQRKYHKRQRQKQKPLSLRKKSGPMLIRDLKKSGVLSKSAKHQPDVDWRW